MTHWIQPETELYKQALKLRHRVLYEGFDLSPESVVDDQEAKSEHLALLSEDRRSVVAYCRVTFLEEESCLAQLVVAPEKQGLGIGTHLIEHAVEEAWRRGAGRISIEARLHLRKFYERAGFRFAGPPYAGRVTQIPHIRMVTHRAPRAMGIPTLKFSLESAQTLRQALAEGPELFQSWGHLFGHLTQAWHEAPDALSTSLHLLRNHPDSGSTLRIQGLLSPMDDSKSFRIRMPNSKGHITLDEMVTLAIGLRLGCPFAYEGENEAFIIQDLKPKREHLFAKAGTGSAAVLRPHTDAAHTGGWAPEFVLLSCVRNHGVGTATVDCNELLSRLDDNSLEQLWQASYSFPAPDSFQTSEGGSPPMAVLTGGSSNPRIRLQLNTMEAKNPEAERALGKIAEQIDDPELCRAAAMEPGDVLVIDNERAVHGRGSFQASFDESDRHLKRTYLSNRRRMFHPGFDASRMTLDLSKEGTDHA